MHPLRRCLEKLEAAHPGNSIPDCDAAVVDGVMGFIEPGDVDEALRRVRPAPLTCAKSRYDKWNEQFGST